MKFFYLLLTFTMAVFIISCGGDSETPACSEANPNGSCENSMVCNQGTCVSKDEICSETYPEGYCEGDNVCHAGTCISNKVCSEAVPNGICENSAEYCDSGICKPELNKYKIGAIAELIEDHNLTKKYHFYIMDITGRKKHQITNEVQSCINKDSCWVSPNYKYFLYLINAGGGVYSLKIVDIPDNFQANFASSEIVTTKMLGTPHFLNDGISFIYIDNTTGQPMIKKYNMLNKSDSDIAKFSVVKQTMEQNPTDYDHPAENYVISPDNKTLVFDIIMDYRENNPSEIWKLDLTNPSETPIMIYKFNKLNQDGNGMNWGVISNDNNTLAFISAAGLQHRLHIVNMDGSSLVEDGGDPVGDTAGNPLGKFIGPDFNSCSNINGIQICDMKSELFYSNDDKTLYFAGKVGKYTDISPKVNLYKYEIENKTLIKITDENTELTDHPMQTVIFNMSTQNVAYTRDEHGFAKNHDAFYLDLNSTETDLGRTQITDTRDLRELKLFFLKR